jgi:hypothetical protein
MGIYNFLSECLVPKQPVPCQCKLDHPSKYQWMLAFIENFNWDFSDRTTNATAFYFYFWSWVFKSSQQ